LTLPQNDICIDADPINLDGGSPIGGNYFGSGVSGTSFDPAAAGPGLHSIQYTYQDTHSCIDTASSNMQVNELPIVTFDPVNALCQNTGLELIEEGAPTGNGGISTYSGPQIDASGNFNTNTSPGFYDLVYQYEDANGCLDTAQRSVEVIQEPQAASSIDVDVNSYCIADQPALINLTCDGLDNSYVWYANDMMGPSIGSGKDLSVSAPSVTTEYFVRSETYCGNSAEMSITVTVFDNPVADFSVLDVCENELASFNDLSHIPTGNITSWEWDFGDGSPNSNLQNPSHTFIGYGTQNINLTVTSNNSCQHSQSIPMEVHDLPSASFNANNACFGEETNFTNTSTAPVSNITNYEWNIDGSVYTTPDASHTFAASGSYNVSLIVETEHQCSNSILQSVNVFELPTADFSFFNPCRSNVIELTNTSAGNGSPLDTYHWDFQNGETSDLFELTYVYPAAGIYTIDLTVTDANSCSHTHSEANVIVSPDFDVSINSNQFCIDEEGMLNGEPVPDFLPMDQYEWLLPDGSTLIGQSVPYTFTSAGTYTVTLVGTLGTCTAGKDYIVEVKELPNASFSYTGQCLNAPIQFTDASLGDGLALTDWLWEFGDGNSSTAINPSHTYLSEGIYSIELLVTDANNCMASTQYDLTQRALPIADFTAITALCEDEIVNLSNISSTPGSFTDYFWNMNDGNTYSTEDVSHIFNSNGNQIISLIVTDDWSCMDTVEQTLFITADFGLNIDYTGICVNREVLLAAQTTINPVVPDDYSWTFHDGSTAIGQNTLFTYPSAGSFNIDLSASKNGCIENHSQLITVNALPNANFLNSFASLDDIVDFTDLSVLHGASSFTNWDWNFDDPGSGGNNISTLQILAICSRL